MMSFFQHAKVNQWTNGVVESCLASLTKLQKPFKYIVTCVIMQVSNTGLSLVKTDHVTLILASDWSILVS